MKKALVIIDVQNDFVDGSLGSKDAQEIIPHVIQEIQKQDAQIYVTLDTHHANYLDTFEGQHLPVEHCIRGTHGWLLNKDVQEALPNTYITVEKPTFASFSLLQYITSEKYDEVTIVGLCTDICVISNALLLRAALPNTKINVIEKACAGVTKQKHDAAIEVMKSCQIDIL